MAKATVELIEALRKGAKRIANKANYEWRNTGACNCGNVVQSATNFNRNQIARFGLQKQGDWAMLARLYDKDSNYKIDEIIKRMLEIGMDLDDFGNLENLNDQRILDRIGNAFLKRDNRNHVILYLNTWADMLEEEMLQDIELPTFNNEKKVAEESALI